MRNRCAIVIAIWLIGISTGIAQTSELIGTQTPPLLPVPTGPGTPGPCCNSPVDEFGKPLEYDRNLLYLPEHNPGRAFESRPRDERATWGRIAGLVGQTQSVDPSAVLAGAPLLQPRWRAGLEAATGVWWNQERSRGTELGVTYLSEGHAGTPGADVASRFFTANGNYRQTVGKVWKVKLDVFAGYRFASVGEDVNSIHTSNQFHGGTIGIGGEYRTGPWSLDARASVALGATFGDRTINGLTTSDKTFSNMPELAASVGREILDGGRIFMGYRFVSASRIIRPSTPAGDWSSFWAQGVMVGLDWWF